MTDRTLSDLARAKAAFQQRTLVAILRPAQPSPVASDGRETDKGVK